MKKLVFALLLLPLLSWGQFNQLIKNATKQVLPVKTAGTTGGVDVAAGLKEALQNGISKQVSLLTAEDGFLKNDLVKIPVPDEMQKVSNTLNNLGMSNLTNEGIKTMNRAAEMAVKEATPVFVEAIKNMSFSDAKAILMGNKTEATTYLQKATTTSLYAKFKPVVQQAIGKAGADKVWSTIITKYNSVPMVAKVNPDINEYVTQKALEGVFKMIAVEETKIRESSSSRTSDLLQKVFALQDKKY
ncbi:MAG: DUF4197 domain-containing protein [Flavobacterium psychrophilum]